MNTSKTYLILEMETGLMDGWYFIPLSEVRKIRKYWDKERPQYSHVIVRMIDKGDRKTYIPDEVFLGLTGK